MDTTYISPQLPKLDEAVAASARQFLVTREGQVLLQHIRAARPGVTAPDSDNRRTQLERRLGWEDCYDYILSVLKPKE